MTSAVNFTAGVVPIPLFNPHTTAAEMRSSSFNGFLSKPPSSCDRSQWLGSPSAKWQNRKLPGGQCRSTQLHQTVSWSREEKKTARFQESRLVDLLGGKENINSVVAPMAARKKPPPIMPAVMTPVGPSDLMTAFFRERIIFIGSPVNGQVAQRVISQLMMLAALDEEQEIKIYINCPGGSTYSVMAIYDCMAWIKPDISTVAFGLAASQGAILLAGGTKGKRFAMPNARIMIHQPQGGCGGTSDDVRRQVNEMVSSRDKLDKMFASFTGQPLELVQMVTDRDRFFSAAEAVEFGLIDGVIETEF
eukprot:TRINITY_DN175_c0_g1_i1.p1 TRINITY_DN175_c0_g1~~TRINITY_DN175_c0_g1_i1.p1  ORF type:complete len:305 (+),score=62.05 TRINITY_DN175_c0_g1_i1:435-1349(+)